MAATSSRLEHVPPFCFKASALKQTSYIPFDAHACSNSAMWSCLKGSLVICNVNAFPVKMGLLIYVSVDRCAACFAL